MDTCQKDTCQGADVAVEKLTSSAIEMTADVKETPLVNGVVEQEIGMVKVDMSSNIGRKMSELQVNIDSELNSFENDEGSPKLNDALTDEQKIELKMVLSNYFSHEYLSKDKFLISQMDYDQFIPVSIVAGLEDVIRITQNLTTQSKLEAIVKTLQEIQFVQLSDGNSKVRRVIERSTLLLREIPKTVPEKDIREIFVDEDCPPIIACEYAHNDSWYVHFGSEDDANRAYKFLRESGKLFFNKPILARFKGKSALTGSYIPPQSSEVSAPPPAPAPAPAVPNASSSVIAVPYLPSSYTYSYPEQALTYYPDMYPGLTLGYNAFPMTACPVVGPMSIFYSATGDQTTVEVINNRQRKSLGRGMYHHRPDQSIYSNEHKQPPRFNRKRAEGTQEREEHHSSANRPSTSRTDSLSSAGQMSPNAESSSQANTNSARYPQRRGGNRGGRRSRHQESGSNKRHGTDGPKPFELETSSFPPLTSVQVAESNPLRIAETKTHSHEPPENVTATRVDQSTTTDGDFESSGTVTTLPVKFSYAQIAKRCVKEDAATKIETAEPPSTAAAPPATVDASNASRSNSPKRKEDNSPKDRRNAKPRNRPQRPRHEEGPKERH